MIKYVKLQDGDDVIADVEFVENGLKLKNPARLAITQQGLGMMPMNPFITDKEITIPEHFVVYTATPEDEIRNAYNSKFGSGLVVPSSNLIYG